VVICMGNSWAVAAVNLFEGAILPVSTGLRCLHR